MKLRCRYEVPREESFPGLGIGMTIDDFQIAGIRHDVTETMKSAVWYSLAVGPRFFRSKILSLSGPKCLGIATVAYSFSNLVRCECHR